MTPDLDDGGWKSRKLWFSVFTVTMLYLGAKTGVPDALYTEFAGAIVAITMAFVGGNVANRWVLTRHLSKPKKKAAAPAEKPVEPPAQ